MMINTIIEMIMIIQKIRRNPFPFEWEVQEFSLKENSKDRRNRIINFDHKLVLLYSTYYAYAVQSALEEKKRHTTT